jgi:hypothetical protein
MSVYDAEGCLIALALFSVGVVIAGVLSWLALLILIAVMIAAHHYQSKYPQATKVSDVWKMSKP